MARYKWDSPYEWLQDTASGWNNAKLFQELLNLARRLDSDELQDEYQREMSYDGYFHDLDITNRISREHCVSLLTDLCIECRDDESVETLRAAVQSNIEDGNIAYADVEALL